MSLQDQYNLAAGGSATDFLRRTQAAIVHTALAIQSEAANEAQTLTFGGTVTGGTYTLTALGATTAAIQWNASAGAVHAALGALAGVGNANVAVTGGPGPTALVVTFVGALAGSPQTLITAASSLTGTAPTLTPSRTTAGAVGQVNHAQRAVLAAKILANPSGYAALMAIGVADNATVQADYPAKTGYQPNNGAITGATNASPISVTSTAHGLTTGNQVNIANVGGNTAANGTRTVTVVDANTFTIGVAGNGAYTSGGTWTLADATLDNDLQFQVNSIVNAYT